MIKTSEHINIHCPEPVPGIFFIFGFMRKLVLALFLFYTQASYAQENTFNSKFTFSGYVETYYSYDFNQPEEHLRPDFLFNFNRHNEFSVNLAVLKASYTDDRFRANFALMTGTYAQYNLAGEPTWAQFVNEASVGVKIADKLWLDMGIMPSHIGFESWYGMDCWHLSRSLMAENSPYFLTGARLTYEKSERLDLILWATNGWQNVQRNPRNQSIGFGLGVNYRPMEGMEINYANYFGNESPQPLYRARFFNNFYLQYEKNRWGTTVGADYGIEDTYFGFINHWYGVTASLKREVFEKFILAGRLEYYSDPKGVIVDQGVKVSGASLNFDYIVAPSALLRLEIRQFYTPDEAYFELPGAKFSRGNTAVTTSMAVRF
ncbi:putative OmpL-like beta-barrel porin-2 [Mongoliibacter ruber]|uniref:Putative OmpL-like beta-barrel porin-2 n=2 Tax=Mongoliibacter ruber TaxID=1750599 RepID=A0A2T0WF32_9BACT|nr:putative OmpL-like beta-barrel porin-2 [Mongoliibacter ruber]